jgi:uncharacterized cofD-like protein
MSKRHPAIVILGGGTGTSTLLLELKKITPDLTAIVTTFDNGLSSGVLRARHGLPAPGDIRRCLAALCNDKKQSARLNQRLSDGHPVGNLLLCELAGSLGSFDLAIQRASENLAITGRVLPVTETPAGLVMLHHGQKIIGECSIGNFRVTDPDARVFVEPEVQLLPAAADAIHRADLIVVAPGSLLTSLGATLAPKGIKDALQNSKGSLVDIANLTTETPNFRGHWHVVDHVQALEKYTGRSFDRVIYNNNPSGLPEDASPLGFESSRFDEIVGAAIGAPLASPNGTTHDTAAVAEQLNILLSPKQLALST